MLHYLAKTAAVAESERASLLSYGAGHHTEQPPQEGNGLGLSEEESGTLGGRGRAGAKGG